MSRAGLTAAQRRRVPPKRRVLAFIWRLAKMGGRYSVLDDDREWLTRYCGDYEPTDTYNRAHELGWAKTSHETSFDESTLYLTPAGRTALAATDADRKERA